VSPPAGSVLPISNVTLVPTPGGATPDDGPSGTYPTWPTPLYVRIDDEVFSYTGKSTATGAGNLTGVVGNINSSGGITHALGAKVEPLNANHAIMIRMATELSKGICIAASDSVYDTRPAYAVAVPVRGAPADSAYTFKVTLAGDLTAVSASATTVNAVNANITTSLATAHIVGNGLAPAIAAGTAAGTGPTLILDGSDLSGRISVTTGSAPASSAIVATVTFATAFGAAPKAVILTPANSATAALSGAAAPWIDLASDISTSMFRFRVSTALAATTAFQWYYICAA